MSESSSRRDFLKGIFGEASRRAPNLLPAAPLRGLARTPAGAGTLQPRAAPVSRTASLGDLRQLAIRAGLDSRLQAVESLARPSLRLIPGARSGPARTAARRLLMRLSLDGVAGDGAHSLGLAGTLTVEFDDASCRLTLEEPSELGRPGLEPHLGPALTPSRELVMPRAWSEEVQSLGLTEEETGSWMVLREQLAALQGVGLPGEREEPPVIHRLLGYPDERSGDMPLACELAARQLLHSGPPFAHPEASALAPHAGRWRLLLQLSPDAALNWSWGSAQERLYVWIDQADLAAGELSRTQTIIQ